MAHDTNPWAQPSPGHQKSDPLSPTPDMGSHPTDELPPARDIRRPSLETCSNLRIPSPSLTLVTNIWWPLKNITTFREWGSLDRQCIWLMATFCAYFMFLVYRCVTPYIRAFNVNFYCTARLFSSIVHCLCDPLYDSASLLFTKIFVNKVDNAQVGSCNFSKLGTAGESGEGQKREVYLIINVYCSK